MVGHGRWQAGHACCRYGIGWGRGKAVAGRAQKETRGKGWGSRGKNGCGVVVYR